MFSVWIVCTLFLPGLFLNASVGVVTRRIPHLHVLPGVEIEENLVDKFRRRVAAKGLESKVCMARPGVAGGMCGHPQQDNCNIGN